MDMEQRDYDSRDGSARGGGRRTRGGGAFPPGSCKVNPVPRDRWGNTPQDEAINFGHKEVVAFLQQFQGEASAPSGGRERESAEKSLDSLY